MTKKIISSILFLIFLNNCGFSPIYTGDIKKILISKSEIVGDKNLAFNLEQKLFNEINAKEAILRFNKINRLYTINCYDKSKEILGEYKLANSSKDLINQSEYSIKSIYSL